MLQAESLHFKIDLAGTYWDKKPQYSILVNDTVVKQGEVTTPSGESFTTEFDFEVPDGPAVLKIRLENKTDADTVENDEKTAIIKDMLLNIKHVEIDEMNLAELIYKFSEFTGDDPSRPVLDKCNDLGWNGTWTFKFDGPFYLWLLENV